ncbi:MAG: hypothetical protein U0401_17405 [Anaerolineae bacterium]
MIVVRHMFVDSILPFVVVVVVPYGLLHGSKQYDTRWDNSLMLGWLPHLAGILFLLAGLALFGWCVSLFARVGQEYSGALGSDP